MASFLHRELSWGEKSLIAACRLMISVSAIVGKAEPKRHLKLTAEELRTILPARFVLTCDVGKEWGVVPLRQVAA